jgi:hypothetical protein
MRKPPQWLPPLPFLFASSGLSAIASLTTADADHRLAACDAFSCGPAPLILDRERRLIFNRKSTPIDAKGRAELAIPLATFQRQ